MKQQNLIVAVGLLLAAAAAVPAAAAPPPAVVTEEAMVPSGDPGIDIYVRNKRPADMTQFAPDRTLVFVHGATYPASTAFDLELGGTSFMQDLAEHGFDVYLLDLPGYGRSTRPAQMAQPADANPPIETTADAVRHYGAVVAYVLHRRNLSRLDVMGWSWGTSIAAGFATEKPEQVERLVLYAPIWIVQGEVAAIGGNGRLGAYRTVTADSAKQRWLRGVAPENVAGLIPDGWFEAWQQATWATDPAGSAQTPPVLRAPNGVIKDLRGYWMSGKSTYDPAKITAPTLLVQAEWDHDTPPYMSYALYPLIVNAPWKRYVQIGAGTHTVIMEKNRRQLFSVVEEFLTEPAHPAP
ncbi:MAG: alpha/beta fold hydrolase [Rhodospirillales bacterium]|nr:alpha/beta fold hydrolase [Rhodospirillales bacterium]